MHARAVYTSLMSLPACLKSKKRANERVTRGRRCVKGQVRNLIVSLMLSAPKLVQAQLSEALSIISAADFPDRW